MKLPTLFSKRKPRPSREIAPQLTLSERRSLEQPGVPPSGLPYTVYDEMQKDSMVQTALHLKKQGVLAAPWRIEPGSSDADGAARAELVEECFRRMEGSPLTLLFHAMDAFAMGWSIQETVWSFEDGRLWLRAARPKDPALFGLQLDAYSRVRSLTLSLPGEPSRELDPERFILYVNRPSYGRPKGAGDLDAAYRHWRAKTKLLTAWSLHLERFAMPTVLGRYERGLPLDEQAALLYKLERLHEATALTYPSEIVVDTLGGFKEPSTGFMEAVEFHNREIARAILGQTLTTDEGRRVGSLALGKVHLQVLLLQLEAVRRDLADTVMGEQVIRPLVEANFGPGSLPRFVFDAPDLGAFATGRV